MKIHKEGHKIVLFSFVILFVIGLIIHLLPPEYSIIKYIYYPLSTLLFIWIVSFFRLPERQVEKNDNNILSSADGTVVAIEKIEEKEYFNDSRLQVSVFMSPLNVHANFYPVSGKIKYTKYHPGKHLVAFNPKSSLENEMSTVVIEKSTNNQISSNKEILVRQIAGVMARRIISYSKPGMEVSQGEEMGFIRFGSRVDLILPLDVKINVSINQKVKTRQTIIAQFR